MGTITINIDDSIEQEFRDAVKEKIGIGKGKLGSAVEQALHYWTLHKQQEEIAQRQILLMKDASSLGKYNIKRDELHDREL